MCTAFSLIFLVFVTVCTASHAATYDIRGDVAGQVTRYEVREGDTLYTIARAYDLGIVEIMAANPGVDMWLPEPGRVLSLPTAHVLPAAPREGIVINLPELRLFYYPDLYTVMTFPIGTGKEGWPTPVGVTTIAKKRIDPVWRPPESIHLETPGLPEEVPPGPDNPLGTHAMNLGWQGFVIHGTNRPYGVGRRSSHGCIRLYPEDIPVLFEQVEVGTKVTVVDTPYKLGWRGNELWLEVTPKQRQADEIIEHGSIKSKTAPNGLDTAVVEVAGEGAHIDWHAVDDAIKAQNGLPVVIAQKKKN